MANALALAAALVAASVAKKSRREGIGDSEVERSIGCEA
jgi:hypothetical protein